MNAMPATGNAEGFLEVNHIGITVGSISEGVRWYVDVLGAQALCEPLLGSTSTPGAARRREIFGERWREMRVAHLVTFNGTGLELFEFVEPRGQAPADSFTYWQYGYHHLGLRVNDVEATSERIAANGGHRRSAVHDIGHGSRICYCADPWGNVIELVDRPYSELADESALVQH